MTAAVAQQVVHPTSPNADFAEAASRLKQECASANNTPGSFYFTRPIKNWFTLWGDNYAKQNATYDLVLLMNKLELGETLNYYGAELETKLAAASTETAKHNAWKEFFTDLTTTVTEQYQLGIEQIKDKLAARVTAGELDQEQSDAKLKAFKEYVRNNLADLNENLNELARTNNIQLRLRAPIAVKKDETANQSDNINPYYLIDSLNYDDTATKKDLALRGISESDYENHLESKDSVSLSRRNWHKSQVAFSHAVSILVGIGEALIAVMFVTTMPVTMALLLVGIPGAMINYYLFHSAAVPTLRDIFTKELIAVRDKDGNPEFDEHNQLKTTWVRRVFLTKNEQGEYVEISNIKKYTLVGLGFVLSAATAGIYAALGHASAAAALPMLAATAFPPVLAVVLGIAMAALFTYTVIKFVRDEKYKDIAKFFVDNFGAKATWGQRIRAGLAFAILLPILVVANIVTAGVLLDQSIKLLGSVAAAISLTAIATPVNALFYSLSTKDGIVLLADFFKWMGSNLLRLPKSILDLAGSAGEKSTSAAVRFIYANVAQDKEELVGLNADQIRAQARSQVSEAEQAAILKAQQTKPSAIRKFFQWVNKAKLGVMIGFSGPNTFGNASSGFNPVAVAGNTAVCGGNEAIARGAGFASAALSSQGACLGAAVGKTTGSEEYVSVIESGHGTLVQALSKSAARTQAAAVIENNGSENHSGSDADSDDSNSSNTNFEADNAATRTDVTPSAVSSNLLEQIQVQVQAPAPAPAQQAVDRLASTGENNNKSSSASNAPRVDASSATVSNLVLHQRQASTPRTAGNDLPQQNNRMADIARAQAAAKAQAAVKQLKVLVGPHTPGNTPRMDTLLPTKFAAGRK